MARDGVIDKGDHMAAQAMELDADQRREEAWRREKEGNAVLTQSEHIDQLAKALCAAQGEFRPVEKDKLNPHFKRRYASLDAIMEMARPTLAKNGLALTQVPRQPRFNEEQTGIEMVLETKLLHVSGQWIVGVYPLHPDVKNGGANADQRVGSSITYARRYAAAAILGIVADEDDDAESSGQPRNGDRRGPAPESMEEAKAKLRSQSNEARAADPEEIARAEAMANAFVLELKAPGVDIPGWKAKNGALLAAMKLVNVAAWQRVVDAGLAAGRP